MAWSVTAWSGDFIMDALGNTAALDLDADTHRYTLWNNSITPDKNASNDAYNAGQWGTANEVYQVAQFAEAGVVLTTVVWSLASGKLKLTSDNITSGSSFTSPSSFYGGMVYDDTTSDRVIAFHYFGGANSITGGLLTLVPDATNGLAYISY